jgi:hypothetical protein
MAIQWRWKLLVGTIILSGVAKAGRWAPRRKWLGMIAQDKARADVRLVLVNDDNRDRLSDQERWVGQ